MITLANSKFQKFKTKTNTNTLSKQEQGVARSTRRNLKTRPRERTSPHSGPLRPAFSHARARKLTSSGPTFRTISLELELEPEPEPANHLYLNTATRDEAAMSIPNEALQKVLSNL